MSVSRAEADLETADGSRPEAMAVDGPVPEAAATREVAAQVVSTEASAETETAVKAPTVDVPGSSYVLKL